MMFGKCFMHEGVCTLGCGVVPFFGYKILTSGDVAGWFVLDGVELPMPITLSVSTLILALMS
ncbi:hypothetical protein HanIR_Chr11g0514451 [Helianthus annuus]|nr:hypothetical protein HanIR_Chr11g0514451 [Helianthus annuus]